MVNFCLKDDEKFLLKSLIGRKLLYFKHDPLDKFGEETVYEKVELFFAVFCELFTSIIAALPILKEPLGTLTTALLKEILFASLILSP